MAIITINGFKVYDSLQKKLIIINSDCIKQCMEVYYEHRLDGVAITIAHNYKLQNVDFLAEHPEIRYLFISEGISDISAIHTLHNLEFLIISGNKRKMDFSHFPLLSDLIAEWSPYFSNMDHCKQLNSLGLSKFNPKTKDCTNISNVPWIKKLRITQSSIISLKGLEKFDNLEELELNYCNKLEELCCLEACSRTLISLLCDYCKAIRNQEYVKQLSQLKTLAFNNGGVIHSIKFLKDLPLMESVRFVGTDVSDGDMTPCIGLRYAGFSNKKHFSHTMEQIKNLS